ncbi:unnamed protein product [Soboliphyme baturini]|uniref:Innexin n=1 Tax=Soboliphyme baturini TaxID=241478 RepID=A0A183IHM0_9BILA|nr:unnamed protein product [Soboliphyme baturini]
MLPFLDNALRAIHKQCYDDIVDRLNYYYSTLILLFFAILVSAKQYVGKPIQCWVPAQFRGGWEQYAESYCFVQNTYFLPFDKDVPRDVVERDYRKVGYYQWVPIVLAIQALLFYIPNMMWKWLWRTTVPVMWICRTQACAAGCTDQSKRTNSLKLLSRYVLCVKFGRTHGNYLTCLYIMVKLLYMINVCGQFFLMNDFLSTNYTFWGLQILTDLANKREWQDSGHFPRVTLCDFDVRELGNVHRHTVQCVLVINMFNEKLYLLLWFWMFLIGVCTGINLLYWLLSSFSSYSRQNVVQKYLRIVTDYEQTTESRRAIHQFVDHMLRPDGVLLLRFISGHAGDLVAAELSMQLYK